MATTDFNGPEVIPAAFASLLESKLPAAITALNATITDGITLPNPAQYLDYLPSPSTVLGGTPIVACGEGDGPSRFENDLQVSVTQEHPLLIVVYQTNSDHHSLALQLRRYRQVVKQVVNNDRILFPASVLATTAGVWGTRLLAEQPGPLLADMDPVGEDAPPRAWFSWSCLVVTCKRTEVGG